jgi:hypothetical protein
MMVLFQSHVSHLQAWLPPNAMREILADYKNQCGGIERIKSGDGRKQGYAWQVSIVVWIRQQPWILCIF